MTSVTSEQCRVYGILCSLAAKAGFADSREELGPNGAPRINLVSPRRAGVRDVYTVRQNGMVSCSVQRGDGKRDFRLVEPTPEALADSVERSARELLGKGEKE